MTARERARVLVNHWLDSPVGESIGADREQLIESIATALADAERGGMEKAAIIVDDMASAEQTLMDDHATRLHRHGRHIAATIATAIRKAQAGKEEK